MSKIYISQKQSSKKEIVKGKTMLVKLKLIIGAGQAAVTPPLGPVLGQYGINIMEFCTEFNNETKGFEKGVGLRVNLSINVGKAFYFEIIAPKVGLLLKEYYKGEMKKRIEELTQEKLNTGDQGSHYKIQEQVESDTNIKLYLSRKRLLKDCFKIAVKLMSFNNKAVKTWKDIEPKLLKIRVLELLGTCRACHIYITE